MILWRQAIDAQKNKPNIHREEKLILNALLGEGFKTREMDIRPVKTEETHISPSVGASIEFVKTWKILM
jgi:hypothetical protein